MKFLLNWLIATIGIIIAAYLLPGVEVENLFAAVVAALILGIINAFIKPILIILTLPINVLTLGLFTLVINALLIMLTGALVPGFNIMSFWWALLFGVVLSILMFALNQITKEDK